MSIIVSNITVTTTDPNQPILVSEAASAAIAVAAKERAKEIAASIEDVAKDAEDARKHAQETVAFEDSDGISFDKGAKGWNEDAGASATAAQTSATNASNSENSASTSANAASDSATASEQSRQVSESARDESQTARDKSEQWAEENEDIEVEIGQFSSLHHARKSQGFAGNASASADSASVSETNAGQSEAAALTSENNASVSEDVAVDNAEDARKHAQETVAFEDSDGISFDKGAKGWSEDAGASATAASVSETNAGTAQLEAETARDKAQDWADNAEDTPVENDPDKYSAKHWSVKAEGFANSIDLDQYVWQDSVINIQNVPPETPSTGDRYIVGTEPTGDWVGNTDSVTTYTGSEWSFQIPSEGWFTYVTEDGFFFRYVTEWERFTSSPIPVIVQVDDTDSPFTVTSEMDKIVCNTENGDIELVFPEVSTFLGTEEERDIQVVKNDVSPNALIVNASGSDTINGVDKAIIEGIRQSYDFKPLPGGYIVRGSGAGLSTVGQTIYLNGATLATPPTGLTALGIDGDGQLYTKDSEGNESVKASLSDITKTGTNANGRWIKTYLTEYTGILKCVGTLATTVDTNNASGNVFGSGTVNIPWPEEFESAPSFCATLFGQTRRWLGSSALATSTTQGNVTVMSYQSETGVSVSISFEATGTFDDTPA